MTLLKSKQPDFLSGEEISKLLGVSRTAIWKHIQSIKEDGYEIDSVSRQGYRLLSAPDRLYPQEVQDGLNTATFGQSVVYFDRISSTNEAAKELAAQGIPEGTVVIAEEQTGGKGRLGRHWASPHGQGVWLTLVLRPPIIPMDAPKLTIMAAVAVVRAIAQVSSITPGIKWPNDVLYQGRKLVGILTEMSAEMDTVNYAILGIGTNLNIPRESFPEELQNQATSLLIESGHKISRTRYVQSLLSNLEELYQLLLKGDFDTILDEWRRFSLTIGARVVVTGLNQTLEGLAVDIDETGALMVEDSSGKTIKVVAGDVTIRGTQGQY
ncbi:MAG: biotin--[acetyl-CoA-carboxylase] ligase [Thermincolia bacterium]